MKKNKETEYHIEYRINTSGEDIDTQILGTWVMGTSESDAMRRLEDQLVGYGIPLRSIYFKYVRERDWAFKKPVSRKEAI
tara:strand:+ start:16501 stop:16740 length:240 start_codon:yes stop_codon:yes gene_type:complete